MTEIVNEYFGESVFPVDGIGLSINQRSGKPHIMFA